MLFIANPLFAKTSLNTINLDWLQNNYSDIETIVKNKNSVYFVPVLNTLGDIWYKRDGATTGEISPLLAKSLIANPDLMLYIFAEHPDSFSKWLSQLQGTLFTDITGEKYNELKILHLELYKSMNKYIKTGNKDLVPFSKRIIEKLKDIEVRVVD